MKVIEAFIDEVIRVGDYAIEDRFYLYNRVLALVGEEGLELETQVVNLVNLKDELVDLAVRNGKVGRLEEEKDCLGAQLMNFITPIPSVVNQHFWEIYKHSPTDAIADFYALSQRNDYIKTEAIKKNIVFEVASDYGDMEITINLSKPEKDPRAIAAAKNEKTIAYPKCQLCMENEGYQGRIGHPARANHRIIRMDLMGEEWGFQYSPYAYFNEHCIFLNAQHIPMVINEETFSQLLAIVDAFPGYFAGSNADLPIVGGSILTHSHYQGGCQTLPMEVATIESYLHFKDFPDVEAGIVKWPMSVIRLKATEKSRLVALAERIRKAWCGYSDVTVDVLAQTSGVPHHTVTPIARKKDEVFELDIVLRDNHQSTQYPDGVYHPHADVQHIKKENIGLIEVMGLAILPPRLKDELVEVEKYLLDQYNEMADYHKDWAEQIKKQETISVETVHELLQKEVGKVFIRVLEDAGVYKRDTDGQEAFYRFLTYVGLED